MLDSFFLWPLIEARSRRALALAAPPLPRRRNYGALYGDCSAARPVTFGLYWRAVRSALAAIAVIERLEQLAAEEAGPDARWWSAPPAAPRTAECLARIEQLQFSGKRKALGGSGPP